MRHFIRCLFSYITTVVLSLYLHFRGYEAAADEVRMISSGIMVVTLTVFAWTYYRSRREFKKTVANIEHIMGSDDFTPFEKMQALQKIPGVQASIRRVENPDEPETKKE